MSGVYEYFHHSWFCLLFPFSLLSNLRSTHLSIVAHILVRSSDGGDSRADGHTLAHAGLVLATLRLKHGRVVVSVLHMHLQRCRRTLCWKCLVCRRHSEVVHIHQFPV